MTIEELIKEYEEYAEKHGFMLNPNRKVVEAIVKGLLMKEEKHGARYCPCRVMTGDVEVDKKIVCPCVFHLKEVDEKGQCICRLFMRKQ
jgi:ferredoxin-thioredoxin reductase catalytic chain